MKKHIGFIAVLVFLCALPGIAHAEDWQPIDIVDTVSMEGMDETVVKRRYEDGRGYALWYDKDTFAPVTFIEGDDTVRFAPIGENAQSDVLLEIFEGGSAGYPFDQAIADIAEELGAAELLDAQSYFPGMTASGLTVTECGIVTEAFLVQDAEVYHYLTVRYPEEATEGYGDRLHDLLRDFQFVDADGRSSVALHLPGENAEQWLPTDALVRDDPAGILAALVEHGALPDTVKARSFSIRGTTGALDMSDAFADMLGDADTADARMILGSVVRTFLNRYGLDTITITCSGKTIETGHVIP